ncbi:hypothetical protein KBB96_08810 [Luteolibacter ambystomatis]|uniref:DUF1349 domain-containing protein n=1 Tax=Luteolibacter ambystomatis TaxID=2824561 RepID=A0A975PH53_9BACT|nr:Ig-like domain-containing protein [Luteolibacter ambystomatis]QUE52977.1 hypothetical protein KBB96_08810 [Luteolibacter ambystomatis]
MKKTLRFVFFRCFTAVRRTPGIQAASITAALLGSLPSARAQAPPAAMTKVYTHSGGSLTVDYTLHDVRGPNYRVFAYNADGTFTEVAITRPSRTYLGRIAERPGAIAAAQLYDDGSIRSSLMFEDGTVWKGNGLSMSMPSAASWTPKYPTEVVSAGETGSNAYAMDVGVDLTHEYCGQFGGNVANMAQTVEFNLNEMGAFLLRDTGIKLRTSRVIARLNASNDPYGSTPLATLKNLWENELWKVLPAANNDHAVCVKPNLGGGVAYVPGKYAACRSLTQAGPGIFTQPWRHELGHALSSPHYPGGGPEGPTPMSGNQLQRYSSPEVNRIVGRRNSIISTFTNLGPYTIPVPPRANGDRGTINAARNPITLDVLANDSDVNGQALTIQSFDGTSKRGGTITRSTGTGPGGRDRLIYTPPSSLTDTLDWFKYRIQDSSGQQAVGWVALQADTLPAPAPWVTSDIGSTGTTGSVSYSGSGTYAVKGAGADIWGTADAFRFLYLPLNGDGIITARVASVQNTNSWAKAGVMMRETLAADSAFSLLCVTPSSGIALQGRTTAGQPADVSTTVSGSAPRWVRLVRTSGTITAFVSSDGAAWTQVGTHAVAMGTNIYIGLAVCSHAGSTLCTASFDNISLSPPSPWSSADVGGVGLAGTSSWSDDGFSITGSGTDIWGSADAFRYTYQPLSGDGEIIAQVEDIEDTHDWAKAGVMIRESLAPGSKHALMTLSSASGAAFQYRGSTNGSSSSTAADHEVPGWVKLKRTGNVLTGSISDDGVTWSQVGSATISMASEIYAGLAVTSHDNTKDCTSTFTDVVVSP